MNRRDILSSYQRNPDVSVLIIGAGINGIGTFRDLALQGVDVLLVDKSDHCAGTSATSSRQAHGGLRYLEHGEFRLVRESLLERNRLLRNAPHAVELLPTTIPLYSWLSGLLNAPLKFLRLLERPSERGYIVVKMGMLLYDWFTHGNRATPTHRMLSRQAALHKHPALNPSVIGAATYYDCLMPQAERIALEQVLDVEAAGDHAHALNYVSVVSGSGDAVRLRDELTGATLDIRPRIVINAAGPWIDFVNRAMQRPTTFIGGTKGSHIVVDHPELARVLDGSVIYFETRDHRTAIFMPFLDKVIIGSTDLRADNPDDVVCDDGEIAYFLSFADDVLPGIKVDRSQIVFHFCGVRPLPHTKVNFTGLISRNHSIQVTEPDAQLRFPVYSLVGGKWTTFRAFAEQVTDKTLAALGRTRRVSTADLPFGGGRDYPRTDSARDQWLARVQAASRLPLERVRALFQRYGTRAEAIATYITQGEDAPLSAQPGYSRREIMFLADHEQVGHLDDVILRRTLLGMLGLVDGSVLRETAEAVGQVLGWTPAQIRAEIDRTADLLIRRHGVAPERVRLPVAES
jgi:glycerol-3-phosphate dehydrogenase